MKEPKNLISLKTANAAVVRERRQKHQEEIDRKRNGIACPKCGAEMYDSDPVRESRLYAGRAQPVTCTKCGHADELLVE